MGVILNIDTSSKFCSVSAAMHGEIIFGIESAEEMDHSKTLAQFVKKALSKLKEKGLKLDAVAVVQGPGSYTGLRIGLSLAKGLSFSMNIPLITLSSLEVLTVRAIFSYPEIEGDELIIPMLDAGRMEVYTGLYDCSLNKLIDEIENMLV